MSSTWKTDPPPESAAGSSDQEPIPAYQASQTPSQVFTDYIGRFTSTAAYAPDTPYATPNYDAAVSTYTPNLHLESSRASSSYGYNASFASTIKDTTMETDPSRVFKTPSTKLASATTKKIKDLPLPKIADKASKPVVLTEMVGKICKIDEEIRKLQERREQEQAKMARISGARTEEELLALQKEAEESERRIPCPEEQKHKASRQEDEQQNGGSHSKSQAQKPKSSSHMNAFPVYIPTPIDKANDKNKEKEKGKEPANQKKPVESLNNTIVLSSDEEKEVVIIKKKKTTKEPAKIKKDARRITEEDLFGETSEKTKRKKHDDAEDMSAKKQKLKGAEASTSKAPEGSSKFVSKPAASVEEDYYLSLGKQRVSRVTSANAKSVFNSKPSTKKKNLETQLAERNAKIAEEIKKKEVEKAKEAKKPVTLEQLYGEKKREQQPMNVALGKVLEKKLTAPDKKASNSKPSSASSSFKKSPSDDKIDFKSLLSDMTSGKVPLPIRIQHLKRIFWELLEYHSQGEAIKMAVSEEKAVLDKVLSKNGYPMAVRNVIVRIRKEHAERKDEDDDTKGKSVSHFSNLHGLKAAEVSIGTEKKRLPQNESEIYEVVKQMILTQEQQIDNCYPHWENKSTGKAKIVPSEFDVKLKRKLYADEINLERTCCRCNSVFRLVLNEDGSRTVAKDACKYHGRKKALASWRRGEGPRARVPECCRDPSQPCMLAEKHVFDTLPASSMYDYEESPEPYGDTDERSKKVLAMDCEMVYTVDGPALARVTVVDVHNSPLLDAIVRPPTEVIDCNTKYSGITIEMLEGAKETLETVRAKLFTLINSETVLIGHSLESDLKTMRIIHRTVVDTAILFMGGRPQKPSLANLASDLLMRFIQQDEPGQVGHSSLEDSIVCMDLVLQKIGFKKRVV